MTTAHNRNDESSCRRGKAIACRPDSPTGTEPFLTGVSGGRVLSISSGVTAGPKLTYKCLNSGSEHIKLGIDSADGVLQGFTYLVLQDKTISYYIAITYVNIPGQQLILNTRTQSHIQKPDIYSACVNEILL